jgi:hypothetical protein
MNEQQKELYDLRHKVYMLTGWEPEPDLQGIAVTGRSPLYTSDYILEKLPGNIGDNWLRLAPIADNTWSAYYVQSGVKTMRQDEWSDTPLKALLKLTIALHDAGELK